VTAPCSADEPDHAPNASVDPAEIEHIPATFAIAPAPHGEVRRVVRTVATFITIGLRVLVGMTRVPRSGARGGP
jgi:hypothetical protein